MSQHDAGEGAEWTPWMRPDEAVALRLAHNPQKPAALCARLLATRDTAPLFDTPCYVRHLKGAYRWMWAQFIDEQAR